jgi:hypothetical protein
MKPAIEKRQHTRFDFQMPVKVFPVRSSKSGNIYEVQSNFHEFQARDISEGGLCLQTGQDFDSSQMLKMNFEVEKDRPVEVFGKVMWSNSKHLGVRFMMTNQEIRKGIKTLALKNA